MHIRTVLTNAELESLLVKPDLHELVARGKVSEKISIMDLSQNSLFMRLSLWGYLDAINDSIVNL